MVGMSKTQDMEVLFVCHILKRLLRLSSDQVHEQSQSTWLYLPRGGEYIKNCGRKYHVCASSYILGCW